jgi:hypothetical protein
MINNEIFHKKIAKFLNKSKRQAIAGTEEEQWEDCLTLSYG